MQRFKKIVLLLIGLSGINLSCAQQHQTIPDPLARMASNAALNVVSQFLPSNTILRVAVMTAWKYKKPLAVTAAWNVGLWGVRQLPLLERGVVAVADQINERVPGANKILNKHAVTALKCAPLIYLGGCAVYDYAQYQYLLRTLEAQLGGEGIDLTSARNDTNLLTISTCLINEEAKKFPHQIKLLKDADGNCQFMVAIIGHKDSIQSIIEAHNNYLNDLAKLGVNSDQLKSLYGGAFDVTINQEHFNTLLSQCSRVDRLAAESLRRLQLFKALKQCGESYEQHTNRLQASASDNSIAANGDVSVINHTTEQNQLVLSTPGAALAHAIGNRVQTPEQLARFMLAMQNPQAYLNQSSIHLGSALPAANLAEIAMQKIEDRAKADDEDTHQNFVAVNDALWHGGASQVNQLLDDFGINGQVGASAMTVYQEPQSVSVYQTRGDQIESAPVSVRRWSIASLRQYFENLHHEVVGKQNT